MVDLGWLSQSTKMMTCSRMSSHKCNPPILPNAPNALQSSQSSQYFAVLPVLPILGRASNAEILPISLHLKQVWGLQPNIIIHNIPNVNKIKLKK